MRMQEKKNLTRREDSQMGIGKEPHITKTTK
jgi:hypothetical protein